MALLGLPCLSRLKKLSNLRTFCANFHLAQKYWAEETAIFYAFPMSVAHSIIIRHWNKFLM